MGRAVLFVGDGENLALPEHTQIIEANPTWVRGPFEVMLVLAAEWLPDWQPGHMPRVLDSGAALAALDRTRHLNNGGVARG